METITESILDKAFKEQREDGIISNIMCSLFNHLSKGRSQVRIQFDEGYTKPINVRVMAVDISLLMIKVEILDTLMKTEREPITDPSFGYNPDIDPTQYREVKVPYKEDWVSILYLKDYT